jgi:hypothetical protein
MDCGQVIAFGERQQSKRVRLEQSITTGNHGQDSWSNPSNAHFNAFPKYFTPVEDEQAISVSQGHQSRKMHIEPFIPTGDHVQDYWSNPSIFHSKSVQWSHAHIPSGHKPHVKPEEILNYPKDHLGTPDISSAATFPNTLEPPWPAESYFDLQDPEWWEKLLTPLQDLIAHDGGHEKINSEKLKEAFSNPFSHLLHPEKDDGTADSFFNSDSQSLMTAAHVPHTDLNPPYGFAKSLKADYSGSSDFHWPKSSLYPEETRGLEVNWHCGLVEKYQQKYKDKIVENYLEFARLPSYPSVKPQVKNIGQGSTFYILLVPLTSQSGNSADHTSFIVPSDSEGIVYQFQNFLNTFTDLVAEILNCIQINTWNHQNPDMGLTTLICDYSKLMDWFLEEVFTPKNCLPVMGKTQVQIFDLFKFSSVQLEIMNLLGNRQCVKKTSQNIASIWYTKHPNQMNDYPIEKAFLAFEGSSAGNGTCKKYSGFFVNLQRYVDIGDFRIYDVQESRDNPRSKGNNVFTWMQKLPETPQTINPQCFSILAKFEQLVGSLPLQKKVPVGGKETSFFIHQEHSSSEFLVILVDQHSRKTLSQIQINQRLLQLFSNLENYFWLIFSHLGLTSQSTSPDYFVSQHQFLEWISEALSPGSNFQYPTFKFPIIGTFEKSLLDSSDPHKPYHPVQLSIMKAMLTRSWCKYKENSMALVGYWLKHFRHEIWNHEFGSDQDYSLFLYQKMILKGR